MQSECYTEKASPFPVSVEQGCCEGGAVPVVFGVRAGGRHDALAEDRDAGDNARSLPRSSGAGNNDHEG
jgi:hypothetical protein